jgi:hypothetical protein
LLVCTTLLARKDKIVDYCQTEDLGAGLIIKRKKEERRKKKEERRKKKQGLLPCGCQKAKDSTFCPNSLQLKEDYLPCDYQEARTGSIFCPNSPLS